MSLWISIRNAIIQAWLQLQSPCCGYSPAVLAVQVMEAMAFAVHTGSLERDELVARLYTFDISALDNPELCSLLPLCHELAEDLVRYVRSAGAPHFAS